MANKFTRPQGTEDVTPKQIYKWHTVEKIARETAEAFGYQEIRVPTFEQTALFQRSVGETTDVVQKEMYTVVARETEFTLRPEGTAGTIRAMLQNGMLNDALPQKAFYILSCFRHERPQPLTGIPSVWSGNGRKRQPGSRCGNYFPCQASDGSCWFKRHCTEHQLHWMPNLPCWIPPGTACVFCRPGSRTV